MLKTILTQFTCKYQRTLVALPLIFSATLTQAAASYICHYGESSREIEVVYDTPGEAVPCSVVYRKAEGEEQLWRAEDQSGFCEEQARLFAAKQEDWGWVCAQELGEADVLPEVVNDAASAPAEPSVDDSTEEGAALDQTDAQSDINDVPEAQ